MNDDIGALFPITKKMVYFFNGNIIACLRPVRDALATFLYDSDRGYRRTPSQVDVVQHTGPKKEAPPQNLWMIEREDRPTTRAPRPGRVPPRRGAGGAQHQRSF